MQTQITNSKRNAHGDIQWNTKQSRQVINDIVIDVQFQDEEKEKAEQKNV